MITLLTRYWYYPTIAVLALLLYISVRSHNSTKSELDKLSQIHTATVQELDTIKKTITSKDRTVTIITVAPDGTKVTRVEKDVEKTKVSEETSDKKTETADKTEEIHQKPALTRYSVSAYKSLQDSTFGAGIAARIGDLPVFGEVLTTNNAHDWALGLRFDF